MFMKVGDFASYRYSRVFAISRIVITGPDCRNEKGNGNKDMVCSFTSSLFKVASNKELGDE